MVALAAKYVVTRAVVKAAGGLRADANLAPEVQQRLKDTAAAVKSLSDDYGVALSSFSAAGLGLEQAARSNLAEAGRNSPSSRLNSVAGPSTPALTKEEQDSIDAAVRQLENQPGTKTVLIRVHGGSAANRERTERELTFHATAQRWIAIDTSDGVVIALDYFGDLGIYRNGMTYGKLEKIDDDTRALAVVVQGQFVAGAMQRREGEGLKFGAPTASAAPPSGQTSFNDRVTASVQQFQRDFGSDKVLFVTGPKSTEAQRKALEDELQALCEPQNRAAHSGPEVTVIILPFAGDVQELANKLRSVKVLGVDAAKRGIVVAWK
jgi:hypothetical protein